MVRTLVRRPGITGWVGATVLEIVLEAVVSELKVAAETSAGKQVLVWMVVHLSWWLVRLMSWWGRNLLLIVKGRWHRSMIGWAVRQRIG